MNPFIFALLISFAIQITFFVFAYSLKTDKVTDLAYGLSFVFIAIVLFSQGVITLPKLILLAMIVLWGLRLATYLFIRILKIKKDKRFDGVREDFMKFAGFWFLQAITVWIVMLPSITVFNSSMNYLTQMMILGVIIWFIGLLIETIADLQKFNFKNKHKDKLTKVGLWRYSRHPNYFGEMTLWWGIFIFAFPFLKGLELITVLGPLYITFLLLFVSGVPPLEKKHSERYGKEYEKYKKETRLLIPLPKLKSD